MKTNKFFILFLLITTLLLTSCTKEQEVSKVSMINQEKEKSDNYELNRAIDQYAKGIARLLENKEVRTIIKEEAMRKFDGDYDILATSLQEKTIQSENCTFFELLSDQLGSLGVPNGASLIREINTTIPNLQIAVPVNCEKWDTDSFCPKTVPVPVDFIDSNHNFITGYDSMGDVFEFGLDKDPDEPVIVISVSERIDDKGNLRWDEMDSIFTKLNSIDTKQKFNNDSKDVPTIPSSLNITQGAARELILEWADVTNENGYKIYRKKGPGSFVLRAVVGSNINGFVDQNLTIGYKYWYKITSFNNDGESAFSPSQVTRPSGRNDGSLLDINRIRFCTSEDLNRVESWIRGVPELRLRVVRGIPGSQAADCFFQSAIISPPSRDAIVGQWWYHNINIIHWYVDALGTVFQFDWQEEDNWVLSNFEVTGKYENKSTGSIELGGTVHFNVSDDGAIGTVLVFYWDSPYETNVYSTNGFEWSFNGHITAHSGN